MHIERSPDRGDSKSVRPRKTARRIALGYLILMTGLLLAPRPFESLGPLAPTAEWFVGPGYWVHWVLYFVLSALLLWAFDPRNVRRFLFLMLLVAAHGTVVESLQSFVPGREVDLFDVVSNLSGGFVGGGMWGVVRRRRGVKRSGNVES